MEIDPDRQTDPHPLSTWTHRNVRVVDQCVPNRPLGAPPTIRSGRAIAAGPTIKKRRSIELGKHTASSHRTHIHIFKRVTFSVALGQKMAVQTWLMTSSDHSAGSPQGRGLPRPSSFGF